MTVKNIFKNILNGKTVKSRIIGERFESYREDRFERTGRAISFKSIAVYIFQAIKLHVAGISAVDQKTEKISKVS